MFLQSTAFLLFFSLLPTSNGILIDGRIDGAGSVFDFASVPIESDSQVAEGACKWRGEGPFCEGKCVGNEVLERSVNRTEEKGFGARCWTGQKAFCCLQNTSDVFWSGDWQSAQSGEFIHCDHHITLSEAEPRFKRELKCYLQLRPSEIEESTISKGDKIFLFGKKGTATYGKIVWEQEGKQVDSWYKSKWTK